MSDSNALSPQDIRARQWSMFIHFSILAGYIVPLAGFIVPILLWQIKKHEHPLIDANGKNVVNWLITFCLFAVVCWILALVLIGFLFLWILGILNIVFAIIGGLKANDGQVWNYPFTIRFL